MDLTEMLVGAVDQMADAIIVTDAQLASPGPRIIYANPAFCRMTGYTADELVGLTPRILQGRRTDRAVLDRLRNELERDEPFFGRAINYRRDGSEFTMEWSISAIRGADGEPRCYVAVQRDVTTFRRRLEDAERLARTDPLTGLSNRRSFDAHLAAVLAHPGTSERVGLIVLDIDRFKDVNDGFGHAAGDAVLQDAARRIRAALPGDAHVARTGGEEIAVVLDDAPDPVGVHELAESLRAAIANRPFTVGSRAIPITASFGVAHASISGSEPIRLAADADTALYRAKAGGRNRVSSSTIVRVA